MQGIIGTLRVPYGYLIDGYIMQGIIGYPAGTKGIIGYMQGIIG